MTFPSAPPSPQPAATPPRRVALVTGSGHRVGRAIALELGRAGIHVAVHYHQSLDAAEDTLRSLTALGVEAALFQADLNDRRAARSLVDRTIEHFGQLDVLVPSAASFERIVFDELDDDAWDRSLVLNAASGFALAHQAAPALRTARGSIVFITCSSTVTPMRNYLPYVVSKAALLQLARTLALELSPDVRVNAVAPGTVLPPESMTEPQRERLRNAIPLRRFGSAEQIARAVLFFVNSDFATGQQLTLDGGRSLAAIERFE